MKKLRTYLGYALSFGIAIFFLYVAFKGVRWSEFLGVFFDVNYFYIFIMLFLLLLSHFFRAMRWKYILKPVKMKTSVMSFFEATMIGYLVNNFIPRAGEFLKAYALSKDEKISGASSVASVFVERVLDIMFSLFFFGMAMLWNRKVFDKHYPWLGEVAVITSGIVGLILILMIVLLIWSESFTSVVKKVFSFFSVRLGEKVEEAMKSFIRGFEVLKHRGIYLQVLGLSFLIYLCYVLTAYFPLLAFNLKGGSINFFTALVIFVVSTVGFILPTPGGLGSYHSFVVGTLVGLYGVKHEIALGYAVLTHGIGYITNGVLGFYFAMKRHIKLTRRLIIGENSN